MNHSSRPLPTNNGGGPVASRIRADVSCASHQKDEAGENTRIQLAQHHFRGPAASPSGLRAAGLVALVRHSGSTETLEKPCFGSHFPCYMIEYMCTCAVRLTFRRSGSTESGSRHGNL